MVADTIMDKQSGGTRDVSSFLISGYFPHYIPNKPSGLLLDKKQRIVKCRALNDA
jgi:hypothetical protein